MSQYPYSYFPDHNAYPINYPTYQDYHAAPVIPPISLVQPSETAVTVNEVRVEKSTTVKEGGKIKSTSIKWTEEETKYLVQLWSQNLIFIESKDTRKAWSKIAVNISQKFGIIRSSDQCSRKLKYLKDKYKECKDWNKNQTGGNIRKSAFYDELDEVLGCRDAQTLNYIEEAGTTKSCYQPSQANKSLEESLDSSSFASESTSTDTEGQAPASVKQKEARTERKRNMKRKIQQDREEEDREQFKETMDHIRSQGDTLSSALVKMQESQEKQLDTLNNFVGIFAKFLNK